MLKQILATIVAAMAVVALAQNDIKAPSARAQRDADKVFSFTNIKITEVKAVVPKQSSKPATVPPSQAQQASKKPTEATVVIAPPPVTTPQLPQVTAETNKPVQPKIAEVDKPALSKAEVAPVQKEPIVLTAIMQEKPEIPAAEMAKITSLTVRARLTVHTDGSVSDIIIFNTKQQTINKYLLNAISTWKFKPIHTMTVAEVTIAIENTGQ